MTKQYQIRKGFIIFKKVYIHLYISVFSYQLASLHQPWGHTGRPPGQVRAEPELSGALCDQAHLQGGPQGAHDEEPVWAPCQPSFVLRV